MLIDIHTHIQQHDPSEVPGMLQRAAEAGVSTIIAAGTTIEDSRRAIALAETYPNVFAGVGIHPADLEAPISSEDIATLESMASHERVTVMSEIGIDHMPNSPDHRWQEEAFAAQIKIAKRHDLPVVFHVREHLDDLSRFEARASALDILVDQDAGQLGGAAHYFQGDYDYARKVLDLGLKISFAKPLLRSKELQDVARRVPLDSIVLETDAYPQPFKKNRARWTEPKDVRIVADFLAQIRGVTLETFHNRSV
ncbi:MAG: TatD family deoxyribonuclease [Chloroflexi bacterium]|nr:TatD family deoxyribonuclease [Chloroflexota bacterium]MYK62267.1 TatD family deoxyribonuclease [Chloroflexota bacterium]